MVQAFKHPLFTSSLSDLTEWSTLRKAKELREQGLRFLDLVRPSPRDWLWHRKVKKAFDKQTFKLAAAKRKIKALEGALRLTTHHKRKKVQVDPNSKFASIAAVRAS